MKSIRWHRYKLVLLNYIELTSNSVVHFTGQRMIFIGRLRNPDRRSRRT